MIIVLLIVLSLLTRCVASHIGSNDQLVKTAEEKVSTNVSACILPEQEIISRLKGEGVDDDIARQAAAMAQTDHRFMLMALRADALGKEGSEVTGKMVKLAVNDSQAVDFVVDFIDKYPQQSGQPFTDALEENTIPLLQQWDERWGYITYSSTAFGCTGCGPTSLSMVYMGLTGKTDKTPADMAKLAADGGYETQYEGTQNQFFTESVSGLGLSVTELNVDADSLTWALEEGMPVICNVGPGDFTMRGHFFVITGKNDDGSLNINDPYSSVNSSESWDIDLIIGQTKALYAYSLASSGNGEASTGQTRTTTNAQNDANPSNALSTNMPGNALN